VKSKKKEPNENQQHYTSPLYLNCVLSLDYYISKKCQIPITVIMSYFVFELGEMSLIVRATLSFCAQMQPIYCVFWFMTETGIARKVVGSGIRLMGIFTSFWRFLFWYIVGC